MHLEIAKKSKYNIVTSEFHSWKDKCLTYKLGKRIRRWRRLLAKCFIFFGDFETIQRAPSRKTALVMDDSIVQLLGPLVRKFFSNRMPTAIYAVYKIDIESLTCEAEVH